MERLMFSSDRFEVCVCQECGLIGYKGPSSALYP